MGFIDSDEYLVVRGADDLPSMLKRRAGNQGGLGINWRLFGSSGVQEKQQGTLSSCTFAVPQLLWPLSMGKAGGG